MVKLNSIHDNLGALSCKKRLGRGIGSGLGKTSGRGGKGQTARSGVAINGFEGGQNPIYRRLPKRGFKNIHAKNLYLLTFKKIETALSSGKIKSGQTINQKMLIDLGIMKKYYDGISLVSTGTLSQNFTFEVSRVTKTAQQHVQSLGGNIRLI